MLLIMDSLNKKPTKVEYLIIVTLFALTPLLGQSGKVFDNLSLKSELLDMERKYAVYLPPDYDTSSRSYPVLYLLHGLTDDHTGWVQFGEVQRIADTAIKDGTATPMIIIMPDADTGIPGYFNTIDGKWPYEDFFFEEFMPYVEQQYRIKSEKRYRAVAGLSMGGGGALVYALHHPELFSSSCPLSAWTRARNESDLKNELERFNISFKEEDLAPYLETYNPLQLLDSLPVEQLNSVRWYFDCGDDDFLFEGNSLIHIKMRKLEIQHEFRIRDGGHSWTYWRASLPKVLGFVSDAFHQY